ncbi:MAG: hypothetical protein KDJ25_03410 [Rhodoblastus sp.]|nr:hypothetical protein [Rhodoblastus sp.]
MAHAQSRRLQEASPWLQPFPCVILGRIWILSALPVAARLRQLPTNG